MPICSAGAGGLTGAIVVSIAMVGGGGMLAMLDETVTAGAQELEGFRRCGARVLEKLPADGRASAKQANFYILFANAQDFRRLCRAHAFDVPQHKHGPMLVSQRINGVLQQRAHFRIKGSLFR